MLTPLLILALVGLCLGGVVPLHNEVDFTIDDPEFLKKLELLNNSLRMDIPEDAKLDVVRNDFYFVVGVNYLLD